MEHQLIKEINATINSTINTTIFNQLMQRNIQVISIYSRLTSKRRGCYRMTLPVHVPSTRVVMLSIKAARAGGSDQSASCNSARIHCSGSAPLRRQPPVACATRVLNPFTPSAHSRYSDRDAPPSRDTILAGWRAPATLRPSEGAAKNLGPATHLFRGMTFGRRTPGDEVCGLDGSS